MAKKPKKARPKKANDRRNAARRAARRRAKTPPPAAAGPLPVNRIGWALEQMYAGFRVRRRNWNGPGQSLELQRPDQHSKMTLPYVYINTVQGGRVPWLASQTDLLADDWEIAV